MESEVITGLIALFGVFVSVAVSYIVARGTSRYNYNQLFAKTVSESRNDWLNELRKFVSKYLAIAEEINYSPNVTKDQGITLKEAKNMVLLKLNPKEVAHVALERAINELPIKGTPSWSCVEAFNEGKDQIIFLTRMIIKQEWERVKDEARGKRR